MCEFLCANLNRKCVCCCTGVSPVSGLIQPLQLDHFSRRRLSPATVSSSLRARAFFCQKKCLLSACQSYSTNERVRQPRPQGNCLTAPPLLSSARLTKLSLSGKPLVISRQRLGRLAGYTHSCYCHSQFYTSNYTSHCPSLYTH
jgi:hypothetical protein